ncbi:MAG: YkgJ family cysteine cluster protein [Candidatus Latescibacteria bacterium]|nr:YkgJ family cysteine cluster protein [Candidatus Latescibacterota bacterium]NIO55248.1 YkgJ family cysteine cluster protein [Candidatus Latescibacterota bacterium]
MSEEKRSPFPKDPQEQLQEKILKDYPRLGPEDTFTFSCHPGISCFNKCCSDVNIFLSPYDVLRMRKRLEMKSSEFLKQYTLMPIHKEMKTPVVMLRMNDDEAKTCPFLSEGGCSIYSDRPWPCRMYPLGLAAQKDTPDGWRGERFYFLLQEEGCEGFEEPTKWTVGQWLDDQGVSEYDEWGEGFKELTLHKFFDDGGVLSPEKMHMFFTACYDLDKFREFVFGSTLLQRFEVDEDFVDEMSYNDETLLRFAFLWLQFSIFGEKTVKVKSEVIEAFKGTLEKKKLFEKESVEGPEEEK